MTRREPGQSFHETFTEPVTSRFVQAVHRAYETAAEHYEPARGNNLRTFGYELYHCAVHELVDEARDSSGHLRVLSRDPSFRLGVGEFELACHRVGSYASDDIWSCFPGNEGAACQMVEPLWFAGMEPNVDEARRVVIAHVGNPEDGFQGLYLCIPSRSHDQKIISWGVAHPVWKYESTAIEMEDYVDASKAAPEKAPEETIGDPVVRRRERQDSEDSDDIGKG